MQQKGFLICKLYNFIFIYFSSNNFNYPKQKLAIPSKLIKFFRKSFAEFPQNFCGRKTKLAWVLGSFRPLSFKDSALIPARHPALRAHKNDIRAISVQNDFV